MQQQEKNHLWVLANGRFTAPSKTLMSLAEGKLEPDDLSPAVCSFIKHADYRLAAAEPCVS